MLSVKQAHLGSMPHDQLGHLCQHAGQPFGTCMRLLLEVIGIEDTNARYICEMVTWTVLPGSCSYSNQKMPAGQPSGPTRRQTSPAQHQLPARPAPAVAYPLLELPW